VLLLCLHWLWGKRIEEASAEGKEMLTAIQEEAIGRLGYFLKPSELFSKVAARGGQKNDNFIRKKAHF
tara:strand:- start:40 stop:243 length:204 start_codon:yes stop_codon:yes gene_type:complete